MVRHNCSRTGTTVIEALIALSIGLVVIGTAYQLCSMLTRALARSDERMDDSSRALMLLTRLRYHLMDMRTYTVAPSADRLTFTSRGGSGEIRLSSGKELVVVGSSGSPERLGYGVPSIAFAETQQGVVRVVIVFGEADNTRAPLVLHDEVLVPAVLETGTTLPFQQAFESEG
jgi:hypothetical protein